MNTKSAEPQTEDQRSEPKAESAFEVDHQESFEAVEQNPESTGSAEALLAEEPNYPFLERCAFIASNQFSVNAAMAGENWLETASKHEDVDYTMAALDEHQEFWTSAWNFKWWDKTAHKTDYRNARMELVDILHFVVSEDLVCEFALHNDAQVNFLSLNVAKSMSAGIDLVLNVSPPNVEDDRVMQLKYSMKQFIAGLCNHEVVWSHFWRMVVLCDPQDVSPLEDRVKRVMDLYAAKAVLNKFRTVHRKSPAGYRKVWIEGREDNDIMMAWLDTNASYPGDAALLSWLESSYTRVLGGNKS